VYLYPLFREKIQVFRAEVIHKYQSILQMNESSLSVNPQEEEMILHCQERLSKNQFDLTVRKDERFLLDLSLILNSLFILL